MPSDMDISKVARLARIALTDEERALYAGQLAAIIEAAEQVQALATDDVPPTSHPLASTNAFRGDEVTPSLPRDEILAAAPDSEGGYFRVPRILGDLAGSGS